MGPSGDQKERVNGQHDNVGGLSESERSAFDNISSEYQREQTGGPKDGAMSPGEQAKFDQIQAGNKDTGASSHGGGLNGTPSPRHNESVAPRHNAVPNRSPGLSQSQLKGAEEGGAGASMLGGGLNKATTGRGAGLAANGLLGAEKQGADKSPFSYTGGKGGGGGARSFMKKHQKKLIAGALAGVGVIPLLALLLFILGALKIPHFVENVAAWRFAKLTRAYRESMTNVMGEKNALDAMDDADKAKATAKYGKYEAFDKINRLRPNKVLQSLQTHDRLQYNYKKTLTGKQKLVSITIADSADAGKKTTIKVPTSKFGSIIHPIRTLDQYKTVSEALNSAMKAHDPKIPAVVRTAATKAVLKKAGASLKGMVASKYVGKSDRDAKIAVQQEVYDEVKDKGGASAASTDNLRDLENDVNDAEDTCVKDAKCLGDNVDKGGGTPDVVNDVIEKGLNPGSAKAIAEKVIGFANPIYDIAVPVCMAYDGSKLSAEALDAQSNATQRESALMLSTADEQKDGVDYNKQAANAMNWKLGNVQNSMALRRVSGKPADTTQGVGGQRTVLGQYGQYTIFDVMFGQGNPFNGMADSMCPTLTNIWVGVGLGVANIALVTITSIFSGGATAEAEGAAATAGKEAATAALKKYVEKMTASFTLKGSIRAFASGGRFAKQYAKDVIKWGAAAAAATFLARIIVLSQAGSLNSGLETDAAFADNVDNGTDQLAGNMMRANYYARPCTNGEIIQNQQMDRAEIAMYNQSKSSFDRYLALSNPNSLSSRMVITTGSLLDRSTFSRALNNAANLLNPLSLTSHIFAPANGQAAFAEGTKDLQDYGNVQWCYSADEQQKMTQDSYASPSENALQLDQSGKEDEIQAKYDKCFNVDTTVGKLLADGDISRNEEGDVLNEGDCSPEQLGTNNPDYGDLVFRWRLKHNYDNTSDTLLGVQDPATVAASQTQGATGSIPTGTAQELAKQILANPNITFQLPSERTAMEYIASTGHARDCGAPAISPKILGVIIAASSKYKIVVGVLTDAHGCGDDAHSVGMAVDLNGINPLTGSGGTGTHITWSTSEMPIIKDFYQDIGQILAQAGGGGMGQQQCFQGAPVPKVSGVTYFDDACTHLHVDVKKR